MSRLLNYLTVRNTVRILQSILPDLKPEEQKEVERELVKMREWLKKAGNFTTERYHTDY